MPRPEECFYTKEHEWVHVSGDEVQIGITDFAQAELGDIVYVELKEAGARLGSGEDLGTIESIKAVAEIYAPVSGEVLRSNSALNENPEKINGEPFGDGWLVVMRVSEPDEIKTLMDHETYSRFLEQEN